MGPVTRLHRPSIARPSSAGSSKERPQPARSASTPASAPVYDLEDETNLPSPFLKKVERVSPPQSATVTVKQKRPSTGNMLRVFAAANNASGRNKCSNGAGVVAGSKTGTVAARRAGEEARKALLRT